MDRLEYLIWRDTIKYKYQLNEGEGLSEEYIENKINELEKTINESMPYFFKGKDTYENNIDDVYFIGHGYNEKMYIVLLDDYNLWKYNDLRDGEMDPVLFCGDIQYIAQMETKMAYIRSLDDHQKEAKLQRDIKLDQTKYFYELRRTPLRRYSEILKLIRSSEYFKEIDFTNYDSVKELFMRYNIFTYDVFSKQNEYEFYRGDRMPFILSNGVNVVGFGYKKDNKYYYNKERKSLENKDVDAMYSDNNEENNADDE